MFKYLKNAKIIAFIILSAVICIAIVTASAIAFGGKELNFNAEFYYVCYESPPDSSSMTSVSGLVHSYGGAGYIANCNGTSYVTVSCYYTQEDATAVCGQLNKMGLNCVVVKAQTPERKLHGGSVKNIAKYEGNLNVLYSISKTCYNLANSVDKFEVGQNAAKAVLNEIKSTLKGLESNNSDNCFGQEITYLIAECEDVSYGYVFSYDIRRLQIAVCDCIVNVNIY